MSKENLRAIGLTAGIGSMLIGAKAQGYDVLGNVEWRPYYRMTSEDGQSTFEEYFDAPIVDTEDDLPEDLLEKFMNADLAMSHPECGNFSNMSTTTKGKHLKNPGDIPLFIHLIQTFKPRFFAMDNLPRSLMAVGMRDFMETLPEYDLFPEWISNWGYGNTQRFRKRFFLIGALREENFAFVPNERRHETTVADILGDIVDDFSLPNHHPHVRKPVNHNSLGFSGDAFHRMTYQEVSDHVLAQDAGNNIRYMAKDGTWKAKPGFARGHWDKYAFVLTGNNPMLHPVTGFPLSPRERARIQGFPDDMVFYPTVLSEDEPDHWEHQKNIALIKQTGKAMPIQFCSHVSELVRAHIEGDTETIAGYSNTRVENPSEYVDRAKREFCERDGYSNQQGACESCWLATNCSIRLERGVELERQAVLEYAGRSGDGTSSGRRRGPSTKKRAFTIDQLRRLDLDSGEPIAQTEDGDQ